MNTETLRITEGIEVFDADGKKIGSESHDLPSHANQIGHVERACDFGEDPTGKSRVSCLPRLCGASHSV